MATKVILPMLGQTMEEGTITKWFKQEGDVVEKGEPLYEVLTDKVNMEVESPESGVLRKIIAQVDDTIPIMEPVAIIGTADESIDDLLVSGNGASGPVPVAEVEVISVAPASPFDVQVPSEAITPSRVFISPRARRLANESGVDIDDLAGRGTGPDSRVVEKDVRAYLAENAVNATPLAAKIAGVEGIDLRGVTGSGRDGKVTRNDVMPAAAPVAAPVSSQAATVIPFTGMRKVVADNVLKSAQTIPDVTLVIEVDMTDAMKVRKQVVSQFEAKYGARITFTDMIAKASAQALLDYPLANSSIHGNEIRISPDVNIGIAVAIDGGLIVPVIRNADKKSIADVSIETKELAGKAKTNTLSGSNLSGATFTISNLGTFGVDIFNPIIVSGQAAILGVCRIADKPVVVDGQIVVRSMMNLCLSFDHRILDGAPAAQFLQRIKSLLETPWQLII